MLDNIARVFPRKTNASPTDKLAFFGPPDMFVEVKEVHISVLFSYDVARAESLAKEWEKIAPVTVGGPAMGDPGGDFVPGMYIKKGYTFTSRGCPNNCWFCDVHKREGDIRELPITEGHNILDSNLLACSREHINKVFDMLALQTEPIEFSGGLEAARLKDWHVDKLWDLRPSQMFFAYDTPDDLVPLMDAGKMLNRANFTRNHLRCYVLIGWPKDTIQAAEKRLLEAWDAGFLPMAMLYRATDSKEETPDKEWKKFQRLWARPALVKAQIGEKLFSKKKWDKNG